MFWHKQTQSIIKLKEQLHEERERAISTISTLRKTLSDCLDNRQGWIDKLADERDKANAAFYKRYQDQISAAEIGRDAERTAKAKAIVDLLKLDEEYRVLAEAHERLIDDHTQVLLQCALLGVEKVEIPAKAAVEARWEMRKAGR